jgi:hypothetical protein
MSVGIPLTSQEEEVYIGHSMHVGVAWDPWVIELVVLCAMSQCLTVLES